MSRPVDVLAALDGAIEDAIHADIRDKRIAARAAVAELIERDRIATQVFDCILRGVNDLTCSMGHRSQPFVGGWLESWAKAMHAAGFTPTNPEARDIAAALARVSGAKS